MQMISKVCLSLLEEMELPERTSLLREGIHHNSEALLGWDDYLLYLLREETIANGRRLRLKCFRMEMLTLTIVIACSIAPIVCSRGW